MLQLLLFGLSTKSMKISLESPKGSILLVTELRAKGWQKGVARLYSEWSKTKSLLLKDYAPPPRILHAWWPLKEGVACLLFRVKGTDQWPDSPVILRIMMGEGQIPPDLRDLCRDKDLPPSIPPNWIFHTYPSVMPEGMTHIPRKYRR